jgi:hypothetical protein
MPNLTDAQEKAYVGEIKSILAEYKDDLLKADPPVDPTSRIANLENGVKATEAAEAAQVKTEAANDAAIAYANQLRTDAYKLAVASIGLMEGALGREHPAVVKARSIRGDMVNLAARGPREPELATAATTK